MKLVRIDELIHMGGVTFDAYLLRDGSGEILYSKTRVGAEGTQFYIEHHPSFQNHWKMIGHYYFEIHRETQNNKGFFIEFRVERQFNSAPPTVELD
jgi:hypothetical protein